MIPSLPGSGGRPGGSASATERRLRAGRGAFVALALAVYGMAVSNQSRLGLLILFAIGSMAALDGVVATQATRRAVITAGVHPLDVVVGDTFLIEVAVAGWRSPLALAAGQVAVFVEPPGKGTLDGSAQSRGIVRSLTLTATSFGLCGLVGCTRNHHVSLTHPLEVGPRPVQPSQPIPEVGGAFGEGTAGPAHDGELVRGVRDYLPGDRIRQVHWRATARYGDLVVKETDDPQAPLLHLVLDMGAGGDAGEAAAGRAAWYAAEALRRGYQLTLTTVEDEYPLTDAALSTVQVNRRLARASLGPSPRLDGGPREALVLVVTDQGDRWL